MTDVNYAPVASDDTITTDEDTAVTIPVLSNDSDPDNDPLSVNGVTQGTNGSVTLDASGNPVYTPDPDFNGTDTFTYTISDGQGGFDAATVTVTVGAVNDAPTIGNDSIDIRVSEEGLDDGVADSDGLSVGSDTTNNAAASGTLNIQDPDIGDVLTVSLSKPLETLYSNGVEIVWTGVGTDTLIGQANSVDVISISVDDSGNCAVNLLGSFDHPDTAGEDDLSFDIAVNVEDDSNQGASGTVTVVIEDDAPVAEASFVQMAVPIDPISIQNLVAGFTSADFDNGTNQVNSSNDDNDSYIDSFSWGSPATGSGQSGYALVDNSLYTSTEGQEIQTGELLTLGTFTHENWPIYSNSSILDSATMVIAFDIVVNGTVENVSFTLELDHTETPNSGADPRDIITLPQQDHSFNLNGESYTVSIEGFIDPDDPTATPYEQIFTDESASNEFVIVGKVTSTDLLPTVSGSVVAESGSDGSADNVVWDDISSDYGTLMASSDGSYSFDLNRETKDSLSVGDGLVEEFTYSVTDSDGDVSTAALTIVISGGSGGDLSGTVGNDNLFGSSGHDILTGGLGNDTLTGGEGEDLFNFDQVDANSVDVITDFNVSEGDALDLGDLLQDATQGTLDEYLNFEDGDFNNDGKVDTKVSIDHDGGDLFEVTQDIVLNDVDLTSGGTVSDQEVIDQLINNNNLITD